MKAKNKMSEDLRVAPHLRVATEAQLSTGTESAEKKKRVIGYVRVSTDEQAKVGLSLESQEDRIREYCRLRGLDLVAILSDPGKSGSSLDRPGIQKALEMLRAGMAEALLIAKLDRLTRAVRDICRLLDDYFGPTGSWELMSLSETIDTKSATGRMLLYILVAMAQGERELAVERTEEILAGKKKKGERIGNVPYGFRVADDGQTLVPSSEEEQAVALMRFLRLTGTSWRGIAAEVTKRGFPTRSGSPSWSASSVRSILSRTEGETQE